jgi:hypothetical protein
MTTTSSEPNQPVREKRKQDYLDESTSQQAAFLIGADTNGCFDNALDLFLKYFPDVFFPGGKFVEGWYVIDLEDEVVVNEHGWCELPDGRIIDPTVVILLPPEQQVYYFPGVERTWQEMQAIVQQKKEIWFPYVRCVGTYGADGLEHPAYKAAYEAATRKVFELALASQPPKHMTFLTAQDLENDQRDMGMSVQMFLATPDAQQEKRHDEESA